MPPFKVRLISVLTLIVLVAPCAIGQPSAAFREYRVEASHSLVGFSVDFLGHPVHGRFDDVRGMIVYVPDNPSASGATVAIATKSINTGATHRDEHLRSSDFFDAAKYPTIFFTSRRIERRRDTLLALGDLTMHGVTREIAVPFTQPGPLVADPHGSSLLYFTAHLRLARSDFGIAGGSRFNSWFDELRQRAMADTVDITLEVQAWDTDYDRSTRWKGAVDKLLETGVSKRVAALRELVAAHPDTLANAEWELTEAGRALLQRGRAADAVEIFRLVSDLYRTSASAQAALARGYEATGDSGKAMAQVRRALEIDPYEPWAREIARRCAIRAADAPERSVSFHAPMGMKTLRRRANFEEVLGRLHRLRPDSQRQWGRITAPQMVCHLTDAFRNLLGERSVTSPTESPTLFGRTLLKWTALYAPVKWPRGLKTRAEADQEIGGTPPSGDFAADVAALEAAAARFLAAGQRGPRKPHYMFGPLSEAQWCRWAFLHMDHHLRQFGV